MTPEEINQMLKRAVEPRRIDPEPLAERLGRFYDDLILETFAHTKEGIYDGKDLLEAPMLLVARTAMMIALVRIKDGHLEGEAAERDALHLFKGSVAMFEKIMEAYFVRTGWGDK